MDDPRSRRVGAPAGLPRPRGWTEAGAGCRGLGPRSERLAQGAPGDALGSQYTCDCETLPNSLLAISSRKSAIDSPAKDSRSGMAGNPQCYHVLSPLRHSAHEPPESLRDRCSIVTRLIAPPHRGGEEDTISHRVERARSCSGRPLSGARPQRLVVVVSRGGRIDPER